MGKKVVRNNCKDTSSGNGATSVETGNADGADSERPQEVVDVKDASSVVSGISVPEGIEEGPLDIPESIAELSSEQQPDNAEPSSETALATKESDQTQTKHQSPASLCFMSPPGKATRKVKKKSLLKKTRTESSTSIKVSTVDPDGTSEAATEIGSNKQSINSKSGKVKVTKKSKSTDPEPSQSSVSLIAKPDTDASKSPKKLIKMKSSKKVSSADFDDRSVKSNDTRSKPTKKKSTSSTSTSNSNNLCSPSLSSHFEKESRKESIEDAEAQSTKSGTKKMKNKSLSSSSSSQKNNEEERSVRSGAKKTKRSRSKSRERSKSSSNYGDDKSVETTRSRSVRNGRKKSNTLTSTDSDIRTAVTEKVHIGGTNTVVAELERQNQTMLEEISILRQQLCDMEILANKSAEDDQSEVRAMRQELNRALSETIELKQEVDECEGALEEKDRLIKKLTDAMDAQLDKVEYLELKLTRAEEEFCNMEDEMKEMEDVIDELKERNANDGTLSSASRNKSKDDSFSDVEYNKHEDLEAKIAELSIENERLNKHAKDRHAKEQAIQGQRDEEMKTIQVGINKQLQELDDENETLRKKFEDLKIDQKSVEERMHQQIEVLRKEKTRLELAFQRPCNVAGEGLSQDYAFELEVEIADLREKIVEYEDHSRRQKEEIALVFVENEEIKQDLQEREMEVRDLEAQFSETKATSAKKMKQKDETISFMQTEMMRIMQEKQKVDKILREKKIDAVDLMSSRHNRGIDEEAEKEKLQAINDQLRQLDEENQLLVEKLKEVQYNHSLRLKENQGIILDLQEELNDAKWELGARKEGADYITLLKDRKDRKRDLDNTRKGLKKAEERVSDLEREISNLVSNKQDLEKEVETLNRSVVSMDSGEYVAGLKRQIKSLKQHNSALERKVQIESQNIEGKLRIQDAKVRILEHELDKLRNPARAALKSVFYSFGKKDEEIGEDEETDGTTRQDVNTDDMESAAKTEADSLSPKQRVKGDNNETEKTAGGIWNLFSPRKSTPRKSRNASFSRLMGESQPSLDASVEIKKSNAVKDLISTEVDVDHKDVTNQPELKETTPESAVVAPDSHSIIDDEMIGATDAPTNVMVEGQRQVSSEEVNESEECSTTEEVDIHSSDLPLGTLENTLDQRCGAVLDETDPLGSDDCDESSSGEAVEVGEDEMTVPNTLPDNTNLPKKILSDSIVI